MQPPIASPDDGAPAPRPVFQPPIVGAADAPMGEKSCGLYYFSGGPGFWRCIGKSLWMGPVNVVGWLLMPWFWGVMFWDALGDLPFNWPIWAVILTTYATGFVAWGAFLSVILFFAALPQLKARDTVLTALYRDGIWDFTRPKTNYLAWNHILMLKSWGDDFFVVGWLNTVVVPREAFPTREQAREFANRAKDLRKTRGASWDENWNGQIWGWLQNGEFSKP